MEPARSSASGAKFGQPARPYLSENSDIQFHRSECLEFTRTRFIWNIIGF
jgi:hypothetical protein